MDDEIERLVVSVRADTQGFARDVSVMRETLGGSLGSAAEAAGDAIERGLGRAIRSGRFGFDDLRRVALSALADIAQAAVKSGIGAILGGAGGGGGLGALAGGLISALGLPGRATGGPVAPGRAYLVGERGPEVFVPTASGQVAVPQGGGRDVRVSIAINAGSSGEPQALARSARQVARAVRAAIEAAD